MNWKKWKSRIPAWVVINTYRWFQVAWVDRFFDGSHVGEMNPEHNQILIHKKLSDKLTVETYIHELLHAVSDEYDVDLSEQQILKLEKAIPKMLEKGNVFK